jgi:glucosamine--fructose-6-phosphate aminotransferase (isomerizing)
MGSLCIWFMIAPTSEERPLNNMTVYYEEIHQQPASLRALIQAYRTEVATTLDSIPQAASVLLTGMGASFHAALAGVYHLQRSGVDAVAVEASDLIHYGSSLLHDGRLLVYVSQSGLSAEVIPLLDLLRGTRPVIAITNEVHSPLARRADFILPLVVDAETTVATKTYLNSLAVIWLLACHWTGCDFSASCDSLERIALRLDSILLHSLRIADYWLEQFSGVQSLLFTGYGPHAATARQAAQTVAEWAKIPAIGISAGALRHGFIELGGEAAGFVLFAPPGSTHELARRLAADLVHIPARVITVENGWTSGMLEQTPPAEPLDEFLSPLLDILPVQLFSEAMALRRGIRPGFHYLSKVVRQL